MSEQENEVGGAPPADPIPLKPRSLLRRLGCGFILVIWFTLILSPCLCIVLATQGEITLQLSDVPGNSIRVWLVNEAHERGLGISRPTIRSSGDDNSVCVQTEVSFIFWEGTGEPTQFCDCYARPQGGGDWTLTGTPSDTCPV